MRTPLTTSTHHVVPKPGRLSKFLEASVTKHYHAQHGESIWLVSEDGVQEEKGTRYVLSCLYSLEPTNQMTQLKILRGLTPMDFRVWGRQ